LPRTGSIRWRTGIALAAIGLLVPAGCGDDQSDQEIREAVHQAEAEKRRARFEALLTAKAEEARRREAGEPVPEAPARFRDAEADRYEFDRLACSVIPPEELAEQSDLDPDSDPEAIAEAYAKQWPDEYRAASRAGCLAGFEQSE
jgi:hypothetical protein